MISASRAGLSRKAARRGLRNALQSGMIDSSDEAHGVDERLPGVALARQHASAFRRQRVIPPPALAGLLDPPALQPPSFFQPIQERIERCHMELQLPVRAVLDQLADLVSVTGAGF